jgi:hypothetical protein
MSRLKGLVLDAIYSAGDKGIGHGDIYGVLGSNPGQYNSIRRITQELRAEGRIVTLPHKNRFAEKLFVMAPPIVTMVVEPSTPPSDSEYVPGL